MQGAAKTSRFSSYFVRVFSLLAGGLFLCLMTQCGFSISPGAGVPPNDARPDGTLLVQGIFSGLNGRTVTGSALVFSMGASNYIVRLEGISVPSETGLFVQTFTTTSGSTPVSNLPLQATSGTQNYTLSGISGNPKFTTVYIFSSPNNLNYGSANLK